MIFIQTPLKDVWHIKPESIKDERGFFARTFCETEFLNHGIEFSIKQSNTSFNQHAYTLRGMHFQQSPKAEAKLIRCTRGRIFDIALDLRINSPSYCNWYGAELSAENGESGS